MVNLRSSLTVIEGAGLIDRWDQRNVRWNGRLHPRIVGESSKALKARGQHCGQHCDGEANTLTALIHSLRSWDESFLHSRRTLGFRHVLLMAAADTRWQKSRTGTMPRKERICRKDWWVVVEL